MELNSCASASLRVKGNTTIMVGDIIDFQVPITGTNHSKDDSDIYYSGRYMISQLRRIEQYKRDGSNGYQQVKGMWIWT